MTSHSDPGAVSWRKARVRRHRELSEGGGARRFIRDALFWSCVAGAGLAILITVFCMENAPRGFSWFGPEPEFGDELPELVVPPALALGFGILMAWRGKRVRDSARERRSSGVARPGSGDGG